MLIDCYYEDLQFICVYLKIYFKSLKDNVYNSVYYKNLDNLILEGINKK